MDCEIRKGSVDQRPWDPKPVEETTASLNAYPLRILAAVSEFAYPDKYRALDGTYRKHVWQQTWSRF